MKFLIVGGGTSGWFAAAYFTKNLPGIDITLIEDASLGPIGVGESTQPAISNFLYECGFLPKEWMEPTNATFKHGVELVGWNDKPYFVDNDTPQNYIATPNMFADSYFQGKPHSEFLDWYPAYYLAKRNISPKLAEMDATFNIGYEGYGAVHFDALGIVDTIRNTLKDKINYVDARVTDIKAIDGNITKIVDVNGNEYTADLYFDCTGFKGLLYDAIGAEFISYQDWLPNDSAVAINKPYINPEQECFPYTRATAMNAGWRWTIPLFHRSGNGYVYSSQYLSKEEAEKELREALNDFESPANHLKMRCGRRRKMADGNVVGIGLSTGFIEPLEATGVTFTTNAIRSFSSAFWHTHEWKHHVNEAYNEMVDEILGFIFCHYYFSTKDDTQYWKDVKKKDLKSLPENVQKIISHVYPYPQRGVMFYSPYSLFSQVQWWAMINASDGYKHYPPIPLTEEENKYLEYFVKCKESQNKFAEECFPNHYEYLKGWYARS